MVYPIGGEIPAYLTHAVHVDAVVVNGAGLFLNGKECHGTAATVMRAHRASDLIRDGVAEQAIFCGRGPITGEDYATSEAAEMDAVAQARGVNANRRHLDDSSTSTMGNWANAVPIIERIGAESIIGVAGRTHIARCALVGNFVAYRVGFEFKGYVRSDEAGSLPGAGREAITLAMYAAFLAANRKTPIDELGEAFDRFKQRSGVESVKRFLPSTSYRR